MPIFSLDFLQMKKFLASFFDAFLPLWCFVGRDTKGKEPPAWNILAVAFLLFVVFLVGTWSPFVSNGHVIFGEQAQIIGPPAGVRMYVCEIQLLVSATVLVLILGAFVLDTTHVIVVDAPLRFSYRDRTYSPDEDVMYSFYILIVAYLCRIWLFGVAAHVGLGAANLESLIDTGYTIWEGSVGATREGVVGLIKSALESPFGDWAISIVGTYKAKAYVLCFIIFRWLLVTLGAGTFYLMLSKLSLRNAELQKSRANA